MRLTYLEPAEQWAKTAKIYSGPSRDEKTSDYNLSKKFTFDHCHWNTLKEFAKDLRSRHESILIYGAPTDLLQLTGGETYRRTENFPYPTEQTLHIFDIDGWKIPEATREVTQARLTDPKSMAALVNALLRIEGYDLIADAEKVIILTSSQWDLHKLYCHIYVQFDAPIMVEAMREFATALAKVNQRTVFDPAIYKSVQPQFFTPPTCVGFKDPMEGKRIIHAPGKTAKVSTKAFQEKINATLSLADWNPASTAQNLPAIGKDWLTTIRKHVGDEKGINEPSYRAAAQLVQSVGRQHVLAHIQDYAQQMFDEVWETLATNGSSRGSDLKDKHTYDVARFRQYLKSATEKSFGSKVDSLVTQVNDAIELAVAGDPSKLVSTPVVYAMAELRSKHYARFLPIENKIRNSKVMQMGQLNKLLKSGAVATDEVISGDSDLSHFQVGMEGVTLAENKLIDTVLAQYDYLADHYGNKFAVVPGNGDGGYRMMRVDGALLDVFFVDGLELSGNQIGQTFGRKVLSKLLGTETKASESTFKEVLIGTRVVSEDQTTTSPTWINLGRQTDGVYRTARISREGVEIMRHQDAKVKWMHGTPPLYVATNEQIEERFGENVDLTDYLMETLPRFIATREDEGMKVVMWACSVFADKNLSYIAEILGPPAAGKSTSADLLKDLLDPSPGALGSGSDRTLFHSGGDNRNFIADIERRHVTVLDNVSMLTTRDQDMLCTVATGLRQSERILYTQSQMDRIVRRPLILTALAPVITRPDLRSRVVSISLKQAPFNLDFLKDWAEEKPFLVAALLQLTAKTLKLFQEVKERPADVGTRDIFLACVCTAILKKDEVDYEFVKKIRLSEALDVADDVGFVKLAIRYLDSEFVGQDRVELPIRGLTGRMRSWSFAQAGKVIDDATIDSSMIPSTGRGVEWSLSKYVGTISLASGWEFVGRDKSLSGEDVYVFNRKPQTLEGLL